MITVIKTDNFLDVYEAIESTKRKIPARILRYCKEQMYDLVKSNSPETKLAVLDIDQIENKDDVEFVVGVGIAREQEGLSKQGYKGVHIDEIFLDIINKDSKFNSSELLLEVYPSFIKLPNKYVPGYKYLRESGVNSLVELRGSQYSAVEEILCRNERKDYRIQQYKKQFEESFKDKSTKEIIQSTTAEKATLIIPLQDDKNIDIEEVKAFLQNHRENLKPGSAYATYFRKLICLIDLIEYGFK